MRFNPKARLDTGRVSDRGRGRGGGGGAMRLPMPGGTAAGGGIGGLIIIILFVVLTQCVGNGTGGLPLPDDGLDTSRVAGDSERYANCKTGEDANNDVDCARVAVENSLYSFWSDTLPSQSDTGFTPEEGMVTFTSSVDTGCGAATSDVGPFYCPPDQTIYLDTTFFADVLEQQLNGPAGDFVEPYVLAHEYGHHIQNLLGTMGQVKTQQGPTSDAVRLELQADCYAGMWAGKATSTDDGNGESLISDLSTDDIAQAVAAAKSVGDDRIQDATTGRVNPKEWTHGSAEQRVRWFMVGYEKGSLDACDTFSASTL